ncbi:MAG: DUF2752 domain-containing protein [Planctomycetes bacterium]|nr:DUF2752 domain-containing protein [Planctomycetota bacterium]
MTATEAGSGVSRGDRAGHAVTAALAAAVIAASFLGVDRWRVPGLESIGGEGTSICMLKRMTGLPCPTCGLTRSFCDISRGRWGEAVGHHPLGPALYALVLFVLVRSAAAAVAGRRPFSRTARFLLWSVPLLVAAAAVMWAVRVAGMFSSGAAAEAWRASLLGRLFAAAG